ncbi:MAG: bifunctional anthranilate synthase component II/anthranilate phosphoribosyltransferase [Spirochaetales bacterium]|nr:bifunctional anthranilate synthase component II/anthranilate phosphoribosyltransferase [Spirochaetales bacterium]
MILLLDNYDSFTYNVFQLVTKHSTEPVAVHRSDKVSLEQVIEMSPEALIISPGPGRPENAGISLEAVRHFAGKIPILGICLGHQTIAQAFGGEIISSRNIVHGKTEAISLDGRGLFRNLGTTEIFTRYHSLAVNRQNIPDCFEISAESRDGEIMGIRHKEYPVEGVQFHPESLGSLEAGEKLIINFLHYKREPLPKKLILTKLQNREDLTTDEMTDFMDELTDGSLNDTFTSAVLMGLNMKGITSEEIAACASVLQMKKASIKSSIPVIDTCGTGGDGLGTFNISSFTALIVASAGGTVAKHGNKAVSSKSGSSDFYTELGINFNYSPEGAVKLLEKSSFTYLHAPFYHSAMRFAGPVRKELGIKTIMNLLGPLVNPADAEFRIIGVYDKELCPVMARAAKILGVSRVMTLASEDGLDEISPSAPTRIFFIDQDGVESDEIFDPKSLGITGISLAELKGGDAAENVKMARELLEGTGSEAVRQACLLNAGAALYTGMVAGTIEAGYRLAKEALESGIVKKKVSEIIFESNKLAEAK